MPREPVERKPLSVQPSMEKLYPTIAEYISTRGHIEIGDQEGFGFCARALDYGGLVFETKKVKSLSEALAALERGIAEYLERESSRDG
jgi:hypothetical protein